MPCYHPMPAVRLEDGSVSFVARGKVSADLTLPCGRCIGCRLERSRQWAMRCVHEASQHKENIFLTLTYSDENLPPYGSLDYRHVQLFLKRLRKLIAPRKVRFFCAGEYGDELKRPHYHLLLFGYAPPRNEWFKVGKKLFSAHVLESLWQHGHASFGAVTFESAAYCARYCLKKFSGKESRRHYEAGIDPTSGEVLQLVPEFAHMSLKALSPGQPGGIGGQWFQSFKSDVYPSDAVVVDGVRVKPPKYYDRLIKKLDPDLFSDLVAQRELDSYANTLNGENSRARLAVKEEVTMARSLLSSRKYHDNHSSRGC